MAQNSSSHRMAKFDIDTGPREFSSVEKGGYQAGREYSNAGWMVGADVRLSPV